MGPVTCLSALGRNQTNSNHAIREPTYCTYWVARRDEIDAEKSTVVRERERKNRIIDHLGGSLSSNEAIKTTDVDDVTLTTW